MSMLKQISVKLTDEEYNALLNMCGDKLSMSGIVRLLIMSAANECFAIPSDKTKVFDDLYYKYEGGRKK